MSKKEKRESKEKMSMRLDLNGSLKEKFEFIKKYLGMPTNTNVLRHLISEKYEEVLKQEEAKE